MLLPYHDFVRASMIVFHIFCIVHHAIDGYSCFSLLPPLPLRPLIILDNAIALVGLVAPHLKLVNKKKKKYSTEWRVM